MAILPCFAHRERARDEAEAKDAESHGDFKVREEAYHDRAEAGCGADQRAAEIVDDGVEGHCAYGVVTLVRMPLEKTSVLVLFVPTTEMLVVG